jgi:hypothetical protein
LGGNQLSLKFCPDFSLTDPNIPQHQVIDISESTGSAGIWDVSEWDTFTWADNSGPSGGGGTASGRVDGVSTEMGLMMYFNADNTTTPTHTLNGVFTYFNYLGRQR